MHRKDESTPALVKQVSVFCSCPFPHASLLFANSQAWCNKNTIALLQAASEVNNPRICFSVRVACNLKAEARLPWSSKLLSFVPTSTRKPFIYQLASLPQTPPDKPVRLFLCTCRLHRKDESTTALVKHAFVFAAHCHTQVLLFTSSQTCCKHTIALLPSRLLVLLLFLQLLVSLALILERMA